jgi:hypothetical protein
MTAPVQPNSTIQTDQTTKQETVCNLHILRVKSAFESSTKAPGSSMKQQSVYLITCRGPIKMRKPQDEKKD